ncbi:hypothetical protein [Streptomyces sp. BPTC-684]|nr:hypothetical protein [Streptomyces sp. BPTC-684]WHM35786.1 hypothetical protein QIY60_01940 [Streptomyces sp. BPTC-684]
MQGEATVTGTVTDRFEREMQRRREEGQRPLSLGRLWALRPWKGRDK